MKVAVLVTDGEQRASLAIVRSLGRAGHHVYVCSTRRRSVAGVSRFAKAEAKVASALHDPNRFVEDVKALVRRWKIQVIVPQSDPSLEALLPIRHDLAGAIIPFAKTESYSGLSDKARVLEVARELGIAIPKQRRVERREDLVASASALSYPLVLKPSRSVRTLSRRRAKLDVSHAADAIVLARRQRDLDDTAFPLLLQERIIGPGRGVFLLVWEGRTLAIFSHERIREKPPSGGVSVYTKSVPADPQLVEQCEALLRQFDWCGALMVEFKIDARSGVPYLMEVNARFWATLQLAIDAGVDFPALLVAAALGEPPQPVREYRAGARLRWFWGDVDNLITRLIRSRRELALPPGTPGRLGAIRDFVITTLRLEPDAVLRSHDPKPFLLETFDWLRRR